MKADPIEDVFYFFILTPNHSLSLNAYSISFLPLSFALVMHLPGIMCLKNSFKLTTETLPHDPQSQLLFKVVFLAWAQSPCFCVELHSHFQLPEDTLSS
jgi:hypothetical protein